MHPLTDEELVPAKPSALGGTQGGQGPGGLCFLTFLFLGKERTSPSCCSHSAQKQEGPRSRIFSGAPPSRAVQKKTDDTTSVTLIDLLPVQANPRLLYSRLRT